MTLELIFSLEPMDGFSSIDDVIDAIESPALMAIFGATGEEMFPTDPFPPPLADNKLLPPELLPERQRKRYF